jgi:NAD(P)-dependent dehydrogenase (short-subunit alcohol dehydrogenase family)
MKLEKNQVAVITGAGSGIGKALAFICAAKGMRVLAADIDRSAALDTAESIVHSGGIAVSYAVDVRIPESIEAMAEACWESFGACHLLCNNAGVSLNKALHHCTSDDWDWIMGVNLKGTALALSYFIPRMIEQKCEAHIVNTASMAGLIPLPQFGAYVASKYAVVGLTEVLKEELANTSIGVSILCPGVVETRIFDSERNRPSDLPSSGSLEEKNNMNVDFDSAFSRMMSPNEVARMTLDAVEKNQLYIMTHPEWSPLFNTRVDAIKSAFQLTEEL